MPPDGLTVKRVSELLEVHRVTVQRWRKAGILAVVRYGPGPRMWRISVSSVRQLRRGRCPHCFGYNGNNGDGGKCACLATGAPGRCTASTLN